MSKEQLLTLVADVDRLVAAGASAAPGNENLRRRGQFVRELSQQVPALAPLADAVAKVVDGPGRDAPTALLDLAVLTRQLRTNLGAPGLAGDVAEVPKSGPWTTPLPKDKFESVEQHLRGHYYHEPEFAPVVKDKQADMRLVPNLVRAIERTEYRGEFLIKKVVPVFGKCIQDELESKLKITGGKVDARRLHAVCEIDPKSGAEHCRKALAEGSNDLKIEALERLPKVGTKGEAERAGLTLLKDSAKSVRHAAIQALAKARSDEALEALLATLDGKESEAKNLAADALTTVAHPQTTARLLAVLAKAATTAKEAETALAAVKRKSRSGAKAAPAAKGGKGKKAKSPVDAAREAAEEAEQFHLQMMRVLAQRKDRNKGPIVDALLPYTESTSANVREGAFEALATLKASDAEVLAAMARGLEDKNWAVAFAVLSAMDDMKVEARKPLVPALLKRMKAKKDEDFWDTAIALLPKHADQHLKDVLEIIKAALAGGGSYNFLSYEAFDAIKELGTKAAPLLPDMLRFVEKSGSDEYEMEAFAKVDPDGVKALPKLKAYLSHAKKPVRLNAMFAVKEYGPKAKDLVPLVEPMTKDKDEYVKQTALQTIKALNKKPKA